MVGEYKILSVQFFNLLEKMTQSLEVNDVPRTWLKTRAERKTEGWSTAWSKGHTPTFTREEMHYSG